MDENTRLITACFEDAIANILRECNENKHLVKLKETTALANWALMKMGNKGESYLIRAMQDFVVQAARRMVHDGWDAARALREIPFAIPTIPPGSNPSLYQLLTNPNLLQICNDYDAIYDKI